MALNKQNLINTLAELGGVLDKKSANIIIDTLVDTILTETKAGGSVNIARLGKFTLAQRSTRTHTIPGTTTTVVKPAHSVIKFKPSITAKRFIS